MEHTLSETGLRSLKATEEESRQRLKLGEEMDSLTRGEGKGEERLDRSILRERGGLGEGVAVWGDVGNEGGGECHPLSQLWRGSGGWAAHRKQLWLHPRPHTEQLWATQSSTDRPTKWPGRPKPTGICLFFILWRRGENCSVRAVY